MTRDAISARSRGVARPTIVIEPPRGLRLGDVRELGAYRGLLRSMVVRHIRLEFAQMHLGFVWALARPLLMLAVFVTFKQLSDARTGVSIPYPLFLYAGLVYWFAFTETVMDTAGSLRRDAALIRKVYYPRIITPLVPVIANLLSLGVAIAPLLVMMVWWRVAPGWEIFLLPAVVLQTMALTLGLGLIFAALTLMNRDWERFLALVLYVGLFASPVIYAPEMIPENARVALYANPMAGTLMAFRAALFEPTAFPLIPWIWSVICSVAALIGGIVVFQRVERELVDRL